MTLNRHTIDGLSEQFKTRTINSNAFETSMNNAGYLESGSAPAQGGRVKVWWSHSIYRRVESIYSPDKQTVITAYHV